MALRTLYCGAWNFRGEVKGIQAFASDEAAGRLVPLGVFGEAFSGQSILALHGDRLVSVCELGTMGRVVSYRLARDGTAAVADHLDFSSTKLSYVVFAPDGRHVFVSSMGDGTVKMIRVAEDGRLTLTDEWMLTGHSVTKRQSMAKVHSVMISPDGKTLTAANLGADELEVFTVDQERETIRLKQSLPVDFGREPRHQAYHPSGQWLYLLTEGGNRVYVYRVKDGRLTELAAYSTLDPDGPQEGAAADLVVSADGRYVYSTNRGQCNIAVWRVLESGLLDLAAHCPCGGKGPRALNFTPDGEWLICGNNDEGSVTVLPVDKESGLPGEPVMRLEVPAVGCVRSR